MDRIVFANGPDTVHGLLRFTRSFPGSRTLGSLYLARSRLTEPTTGGRFSIRGTRRADDWGAREACPEIHPFHVWDSNNGQESSSVWSAYSICETIGRLDEGGPIATRSATMTAIDAVLDRFRFVSSLAIVCHDDPDSDVLLLAMQNQRAVLVTGIGGSDGYPPAPLSLGEVPRRQAP